MKWTNKLTGKSNLHILIKKIHFQFIMPTQLFVLHEVNFFFFCLFVLFLYCTWKVSNFQGSYVEESDVSNNNNNWRGRKLFFWDLKGTLPTKKTQRLIYTSTNVNQTSITWMTVFGDYRFAAATAWASFLLFAVTQCVFFVCYSYLTQ